MDLFEELASRAEARWQAVGGEDERFSDVAAEVLEQARLPERLDPLEGLRLALTPALLEQRDENEYGEPALTVARRERFRVELIYWIDGAARIHQHVAWGAFSVVCGERLHLRYRFERPEPRPGGVLLGQLELEQLERLGPGDTRRICPGFGLIHALFFLGRPCLTVSLRSIPEVREPYWVYYNRRLAFDVGVSRLTFQRRHRAWELLSRLEPQARIQAARRLLQGADLLSTCLFLDELEPALPPPAFESLRDDGLQAHGPRLAEVRATSAEELERGQLEALLARHDEPELRLALGLMWCAASGASAQQVRALLARFHPGRAGEALLAGWLVALCGLATEAAAGDRAGRLLLELALRFRARLGLIPPA